VPHAIIVHATPDPRTFGVECSCGWRTVCFFGEPSVELAVDHHLFDEAGVERKVVLL